MKTIIAFILALSCSFAAAEDNRKEVSKVDQILTAMIRDVLLGDINKSARAFYGTEGDKTVILLNGSELDHKEVKWPKGFKPSVEGYTFVFGAQNLEGGGADTNRRLAIRLDRCVIDEPDKPDEEMHDFWDRSPIRISIQNGGGSKNGAVIGGRTTFYSFLKLKKGWIVVHEGAIS